MSADLIQKKDNNTALLIAIDEFTKVAQRQNVYVGTVDALKVNLQLENETINAKLKESGFVDNRKKCFDGEFLGFIITDNAGL